MSEMRILTVRQPWAEAIIFGGKGVENRVRNVAGGYRGPVAIHTAKREATPAEWREFDRAYPEALSRMAETVPWGQDEYGVIIGVVDLVDVHVVQQSHAGTNVCFDDSTPTGDICSQWAHAYDEFPAYRGHHLVLANPRPLAEPIPYRGALGLRRLNEAMVQRIEAAIA